VRAQLADSAAELARVEGLLASSGAKHEQLAQALADRAVEVRYKDLTARQLTPFAVAGRVALEVGATLQQVFEAIDARTALLLTLCPLEAQYRDEMEALRGDAIRAGSLVRQIDHARAEAPLVTELTDVGTIDVEPSEA
jgi:hypothetical protein